MQILVKVKPNARCSELEQLEDETWVARVKAPPVDGKANAELIRVIAEHFRVRKSCVTIASGTGSRLKRVQINDK